jgi:hypothetical protein
VRIRIRIVGCSKAMSLRIVVSAEAVRFRQLDLAESGRVYSSPTADAQGNVYDVTEFLENHPGGPEIIVANAGKDAS